MKATQLLVGIVFASVLAPFTLAQSSVSVSVKRANSGIADVRNLGNPHIIR